jgi:hypothetical protein
LGENRNTIEKNIEALLEARREVSLEVGTEKAKDMVVSHHQNIRRNHNLMVHNRSLKIWQSSNT